MAWLALSNGNVKIRPAPFVYRPLDYGGRAERGSTGRRASGTVPRQAATSGHDEALLARDATIRRMAADPGFAVVSAAAYVAQQMGQMLAEDDEAAAREVTAAYRRCEEAVGTVLHPPMDHAGITA